MKNTAGAVALLLLVKCLYVVLQWALAGYFFPFNDVGAIENRKAPFAAEVVAGRASQSRGRVLVIGGRAPFQDNGRVCRYSLDRAN